jgi:hypothetical protein
MSTGGVFTLITNSGIQDRLLLASDALKKRIEKVEILRKNKAVINTKAIDIDLADSWAPDVYMINKSHNLFVNCSFKPFVACGFEYNKIQPNGRVLFGNDIKFTLPVFGDFVNDIVLHVKLKGLKAVDNRDRVRYVSLLAHKIFSKVSFKINGNPLDEYTSDDYNAYYQYRVLPHKKVGWLRNMGQEIPDTAYLTSDPTIDFHREYKFFGSGNQTFKQFHDDVELWIPLLFWFKDAHNALPNVAIPHGQPDITVTMAEIGDLVGFGDYGGGGTYVNPTVSVCEMYMNNIFLNPEVHNIFIKKFGFSLIRVHGHHNKLLNHPKSEVLLNGLNWPTETLYVAFRPRANLALSQYWHNSAVLTKFTIKTPVVAKAGSGNITIGNITTLATDNTAHITGTAGPVLNITDNFYNGYDFIITGGTGYSVDDVATNRYMINNYVGGTQTITIDSTWNHDTPDSTTIFELFKSIVAINLAQYYKQTPSIDSLEVKAHGVVIYRDTDESFYNSYLPLRFGTLINTPTDRGWYMINFNFTPGEHQPSGHLNLSRAREFYFKYRSSYINSDTPVDLIVLSDAINFLLIRNGSAVLRYST